MHRHHGLHESSAEIFASILSCQTHAEIAERVLNPVADMLGARSAVFLQICSSTYGGRHFGVHDYVGDTPNSIEVYLQDQLYDRDPVMQPAIRWLNEGLEGRSVPAILTGSVEANLGHDRLYRESFLRPYDIGHVVAIAVPMKTGLETQLACLGFHRGHSDKGFRPDQIAYFRSLAPAIQSTLFGVACREAIQVSEAITQAAQQSGLDMGYLVLDEDLVVRNGNARGLRDLGLVGSRTGLSPLLGDIKQRLLEVAMDEGGQLCLKGQQSGSVNIHVRSFRSASGDPYYLVSTISTGANRSIGDACRGLGLTERETEIAILIAAGQCNASIGQELNISLRTTENHLRSIYRKAGVASRTQLISRMLQIQ